MQKDIDKNSGEVILPGPVYTKSIKFPGKVSGVGIFKFYFNLFFTLFIVYFWFLWIMNYMNFYLNTEILLFSCFREMETD